MSLLFTSPFHWWSQVLIEMNKLVEAQMFFFEWHVQRKIETYAQFCELYKFSDSESISPNDILCFVKVLSSFIQIHRIGGQYSARISRGVTLSDACLLLYGASALFQRLRSKMYYDRSYKAVLGPLGSLRSSLGGLVEFYREHVPGPAHLVNWECQQISIELSTSLRVIKEDINLVCFFFGMHHKRMYVKMSRIEHFNELIPKSVQGEAEECSICLDTRLTPATEITILDSCPHVFCSPCAVSWFTIQNRCPLCRARVRHFASRAQFELFKQRQMDFRDFHARRARGPHSGTCAHRHRPKK